MGDIRAILLTDVVDSTKLSESVGDHAMAAVWAAHDRVARDLLALHGGREIDKTDGMLFLFDTVDNAVAYALAYHSALAQLPMPLLARAGVHAGPVLLRENSSEDIARGAKPLEVHGLAKPTAARVMSVAKGGQTLLTQEARKDLSSNGLQLESHGHWLMKGLSEPVELFEIGQPGNSFGAPADTEKCYRVAWVGEHWVPTKQIPNNLPHQVTSFLGRRREMAEIKSLLVHARLLTLVGMGGMGKTRLSLQLASELVHDFPDGVWFLDLAPLRDATLVTGEAARVLGVQEASDRTPMETICTHLKPCRALLILDNCEHLLAASADLAGAVLRSCPDVRIVASSRASLHAPGEQVYPILPLPVPNPGDGVEALSQSTAVRLFLDRARSHQPSFSLTEREAPVVAELVRRLEGIPLALELAAARIRSLTVADINARLKDRYKMLTGGRHGRQERQQTLRALVDWSYDLLSSNEQIVLSRLGVFVGGLDLAAAEYVCGAAPLLAEDVLDILASLVDKSLLTLEEAQGATRYRMLETIRDYAVETLERAGSVAATRTRHCDHFFALAKAGNRGLKGPAQAEWIERIETELDNVRAAIALTLAGGADPIIAVKFAVAMMGFWLLRGYTVEGRTVIRAALALPLVQASELAQAHALYVGAALAEGQSDYAEARQLLERCLALRRGLGNPVDIAATLSTLSLALLAGGEVERARAEELEALQIFRQLGDRFGESIGLLHLAQIALYASELPLAQAHLEACVALAREIGNREVEGECERWFGVIAFQEGDAPQARSRFERSLGICRDSGDKRGQETANWWLGKADLESGDTASARVRLREALRAFRAFRMQEEVVGCLEDHSSLAGDEGDAGLAVRLAAAAAALRERLQLPRTRHAQLRWESHMAGLRRLLDTAEFEIAFEQGRGWETDSAVRAAIG